MQHAYHVLDNESYCLQLQLCLLAYLFIYSYITIGCLTLRFLYEVISVSVKEYISSWSA
jgi:hypothetical protein